MAAIWCTILGLDEVGVEDNFFEIGGNSLQAVQIVARIRTDMGITVPLRSIFQTRTVAGFAGVLAKTEVEVAELLAEIEQLSDRQVTASPAADPKWEDPGE